MKIAYILSSLENAGPINVALDLVKTFTSFGHYCEVFYFSPQKRDVEFPCKTVHIDFNYKFPWESFDVIHTHGGRPDLFILTKKPTSYKGVTVTTIHSNVFEDHRFKYGKLKSWFTSRAILLLTYRHDKVVVLSNALKKIYSRYLPERKLNVAYNTRIIDESLKIEQSDEVITTTFRSKFKHVIGTFCGIHVRKGLEQIISVLPQMPDTGFIVVGDGNQKNALEEYAETLGCRSQILFLGQRDNAYRYLSEMDVFVIPSRSEGFPLALLEACAWGKPVVVSDIAVFQEIMSPTEAAFFKLDDSESLLSALGKAFSFQSELARASHHAYITRYAPKNFYEQHMGIYES